MADMGFSDKRYAKYYWIQRSYTHQYYRVCRSLQALTLTMFYAKNKALNFAIIAW